MKTGWWDAPFALRDLAEAISHEVWEKKPVRVKTFVLGKRLKNKQIVILMHHFSKDCIWNHLEPGYLPKISNLMQNNFFTWKDNLYRNFCGWIHQQIRILRFHSHDNVFCNRPIFYIYIYIYNYIFCWRLQIANSNKNQQNIIKTLLIILST